MRRGRNNPAGFTLMEVVVAISLTSIVMLILFTGLRLAANAWSRGAQKLEEHARLMAGNDALGQQIASATVHVVKEVVGTDKQPIDVLGFRGSSSELRFCTWRSWRGDRSRPEFLADYRVVKSEEGKQQLVISETGLTDDDSVVSALEARSDERISGERVGDAADGIELAYFQPATVDQPAQWVSDWPLPQTTDLPVAVRVRWTRGRDVQDSTFVIAIRHDPKVR